MVKPLSLDLRKRLVAAVAEGGSLRTVAAGFEVAPSSVQKIAALYRETGSVQPRTMGGDRRSHVIEANAAQILELLAARPDLTLEGMRAALRATGVIVGYGGLRRFLQRHNISFKKKRCMPANRTDLTSPAGGRAGGAISTGSIRPDWSLSTRPGPRPT